MKTTPSGSDSPVWPRAASAWPFFVSLHRPHRPPGAACRRGATGLTRSPRSDRPEPEAPRAFSANPLLPSSPLSDTERQRGSQKETSWQMSVWRGTEMLCNTVMSGHVTTERQ